MRTFKRIALSALTLAACIGVIYLWSWCENQTIDLSYYSVYSDNVEDPIRVVLLTDLHQKTFGENNQKLLDKISGVTPDLILIAGDTLNSDHADINYAVELCAQLQNIASVYFGMGNHENRIVYGMDLTKEHLEALDSDDFGDFSALIKDSCLLDRLDGIGVTVLQNSAAVTEVNGNSVAIGGVSTNMDAFWPYSGDFLTDFVSENTGRCKILLSHFPSPTHSLSTMGIDLILAGHNHGGVIRLPGLGGLYANGEGFFPKDVEGMTSVGDSTLIISRGLGGHGLVPRLFNPPELVVIDIS